MGPFQLGLLFTLCLYATLDRNVYSSEQSFIKLSINENFTRKHYLKRRIPYNPNSTASFQLELLHAGDVHPNPGPDRDQDSTVPSFAIHRDPPLQRRIHYSPGELLQWRSTKLRLSSDVRDVIHSFGIQRRKTRRGRRGSRRRNYLRQSKVSRSSSSSSPNILLCSMNVRSVRNKSALIHDFICDSNADLITMTETWLTDNDSTVLNEFVPSGYKLLHRPRSIRRGGGTGLVYRESINALQATAAIEKIQKVRRSLKRSSRRVKSALMTREDSTITEVAMETEDMNHTAPLATLATTPIDEDIIFESRGQKKRGGTFPRMAHFDLPEDTPPGSQNGTLKANGTHRPQRQNGSLKGPWNRKNRGKGVPVVKEDTAKVLEMYLKRRSKSLNDAVLTREYFAQEKKKRGRSARNNTVSICSTLSTDSTASEVHVQPTTTAQLTSDAADRTVFSRASVTQQSFHEAMKCSIMEEGSAMEQSADDELSSSDEQSPRSRSAPSTLRMQVNRENKEGMDTLKLKDKENGTATLTRDGYKRDSKKEPRRKRSFLDKAKNIMRSPSTSRKIIRTPSAVQRQEENEKERLKEEKEKEKERLREEKEREKEKQRKEKEEKELLDKKLKEYKEREKEKLKEMERRRKEEKEREKEWEKERERLKKEREKKEKEEMERSHTRHHARTVVHSEMKKTGFTARLKESFRRSSRDRHHHNHHRTKDHIPSKPPELPPRPPELQQPKDAKPKRWPSFQFKRKSRKSASTPTDESGTGATTPSDTASMDFEYFASRVDHTRSLNDAERRRLTIEMRQARRENSGNASDSQVLDRVAGAHPPLSEATSHDSFGSFASSEGSERPERPRTLAFRRTRAERAQRGLNNVIRLDSTTPGHVRRDVDTSFPVLPAALLADDLVRDGGTDRAANGGGEGADRNVTDSWTESGDGSDIPFEQRNQAEREEYFKRIADRLAMIGDQALEDYEFNDGAAGGPRTQQRPVQSTCATETYASCSMSAGATAAPGISHNHAAEYMEIGQRIQTDVDGMQLRRRSQAYFPAGMVMGVIMNDTYQSFCSAMQSIVGQDVGMEQLAIVFKFTKVAVRAANSMGKHASSIKDNSVRFISDRFAGWLDSQGGWPKVEEQNKTPETDV